MFGHRLIDSSDNIYFYGATKFAVTALTEGTRRELWQISSTVKFTVRRKLHAACIVDTLFCHIGYFTLVVFVQISLIDCVLSIDLNVLDRVTAAAVINYPYHQGCR